MYQGWHLREAFRETDETSRLNLDLRKVGKPILLDLLTRECAFMEPVVLQIAAVVDTSRPQCGKGVDVTSSKPLIMVKLTDGHASLSAVLMGPVAGLSESTTVPGTKVLLFELPRSSSSVAHTRSRGGVLSSREGGEGKEEEGSSLGACLVAPEALRLLGGRVPSLAKEFERQKRLAAAVLHQRFTGGGGGGDVSALQGRFHSERIWVLV
jgi:hypothetical protein